MNLSEILERHARAAGGRWALETVQGIRIAFTVVEPGFSVEGLYIAERVGRMRVDIFAGGERVFSEGFDGDTGWQLPKGAETALPTSSEGLQALQSGIENQLYGLHELPARGHRLELDGPASIEGETYHVVAVRYAGGKTVRRYVSARTWRVERTRERKALHPDFDAAESVVETVFTDFRKVGGVLRPFRERVADLGTDTVLQTTEVGDLQINPQLKPDDFAPPRP